MGKLEKWVCQEMLARRVLSVNKSFAEKMVSNQIIQEGKNRGNNPKQQKISRVFSQHFFVVGY